MTIGLVVAVVGCGDNSTFKGFNSEEERPSVYLLYQTDIIGHDLPSSYPNKYVGRIDHA